MTKKKKRQRLSAGDRVILYAAALSGMFTIGAGVIQSDDSARPCLTVQHDVSQANKQDPKTAQAMVKYADPEEVERCKLKAFLRDIQSPG
ncbi:hypothetical protein [Streptomyces sp. NPDC005407]|uniref:hypothetical protein n=1 Tax=Streptomyces sp. NPDC005407 TaxID=3155340 RepID=UPI0033A64F40